MAKKKPPAPRAKPPLTKELVLEAIAKAGGAAAKRDLARLLDVGPNEKKELRLILRELEADGALGRTGRRSFASAEALPATGVLEIIDRDADGELIGRMRGDHGLFGPPVKLAPGEARGSRSEPAIGVGDRVLAKIIMEDGEAIARVMKRLGQSAHRILGVFHQSDDPRARGAGRVEPADRKVKHDLMVFPEHRGEARDGDLVLVELATGGRPHGPKRGVVKEIVGRMDDPRAASILAMHSHGITHGFTEDEEAEAAAAQKPTLKGRTDLRDLPLITIDPEDARDHDDAVYAQADDNPKNKGGWRVWVAIADVAAYVRPGSALDRGARRRGNSTYFPDRVAPMLPESLSADLCSLREAEPRACLAVEMIFDREGRKIKHQFVRGLMKSAAKLTYAQAQGAFDGKPDEKTAPLQDTILRPLWEAYQCMLKGRAARQPLALEGAEHRIVFGPDGRVAGVRKRVTLDANRLIEEMMIQANVCAAETLEAKTTPLVYRVHDRPSDEKIAQLMDFLPTVGLAWAKGQVVLPARFNRLLEMARQTEHADIVNEVVLRTQAQAIYSPENLGHFGLNLAKYAHFTSPIRRYADVIVHRGLIRALGLGQDGLTESEAASLDETAQHISTCERRSMAAEREATDRYIASFLADRVGHEFEGRVSGVTRFGLFVKLTETNADGLVPVSTLGYDRWVHDEAAHALVNERTGERYTLGQIVEVKLAEATPVSGGLVFEMLSEARDAVEGWRKAIRKGGRGRDHTPFRSQRSGQKPSGKKPSQGGARKPKKRR
jgi:ribonuclease R